MSSPTPRTAPPSPRRDGRTRRSWRAAVLVVAAVLGPLTGVGAAPSAAASASARADRDAAAADRTLSSATGARVAAERRRDELAAELATVTRELDLGAAGAAQVAQDLEAARRSMRAGAIAAYVAADADPSLALLGSDDLSELSAERTFARRHTLDWADAAVRFQELKDQNDPALVALAERRAAVAAQLDDAVDAALQASAVEAEAERSAVEAQRRAEEAAAQAAAAARSATTVPSVRTPAASNAPAAPSPAAPTRAATPAPTAVVPHDEPSAPLPELPPFGPSPEAWAEVRRCESGGNYRAVSRSGRYRGAYQFDNQTWEAMGGLGDPAAAPPVEQDARAALLFARRGARAWPVCGRALLAS